MTTRRGHRALRLAVLHDLAEEGWPSMDQMGQLVATRVPRESPLIETTVVRPKMVRIGSRLPLDPGGRLRLADRIVTRALLYPRFVRREVAGRFSLYHVVDHSYAHLVHELPSAATIVTCHDTDAFRCLVSPADEPRSRLFRLMASRVLSGLRRAAVVVCGSEATASELVRHGLASEERLRVVPNGIDPEFLREPSAVAREWAAARLSRGDGAVDLLHVGSDIPRKRVDRLLEIAAAVQASGQPVRLVRVGAPMTDAHRRQAQRLDLRVLELPFLDSDVLHAVYERCRVLLLPSDREGFGLPVLEAFAVGRPAVVSDIPALREVSGGLARRVPPDDIRGWVAAIQQALRPQDAAAGEYARRAHAASLTWDAHARGLLPIYDEVLDAARGVVQCA